MVVRPGYWLCVGASSPVPEALFSPRVWYYGADREWFCIGCPVAVWQDAVVVQTTIPGRFLIIPDKLYMEQLPQRFYVQRFLAG